MNLRLHLFGAPRIERDGQIVHVDTRKAIALIAYLVGQGGYQSRDTLGALLWAESDQGGARAALRRTLSALNAAIEGTGLLIEREAIAFDPSSLWCDVTVFTQAIAGCAGHSHDQHIVCEQCLPLLNEAASVYKGDFLQGFTLRDSAEFDLWQFQQTEHLRRLYSVTLEKLVHLYSISHDYLQAIELAQMWLALDPLHEAAHRQLMQLYAWADQRAMALRQYRECVRVLQQELGVPPLDETSSLYQQVMENRIEPRSIISTLTPISISPETTKFMLPLTGRDAEMSRLELAYSHVSQQVVVIEGEAGIGKTRLTEDFIARCRTAGHFTAVFRCFESETSIAYAPVIRLLRDLLNKGLLEGLETHWLTELGRLLPEIQSRALSTPAEMNNTAAQTRLYEAICQTIAHASKAAYPHIILFEDIHWSDNATLEFAAYALRRSKPQQIMFMFTWRSEEMPRGHHIQLTLAEYIRSGEQICHITLPRFTKEHIHQLVSAASLNADSLLIDRLYSESEGLPLFVYEYLSLIRTNTSLQNASEWETPIGMQALLRSRIDQLSKTARQILDAAAVIGRAFDFDLVRECGGRTDDETVDGLDELQQRGILYVGEEDIIIYIFRHEKLRAATYKDLSLARKRLLHGRAAQAILNRVGHTDKLPASAALVAYHFQLAGQEVRSADYYVIAGRYAQSLFANHEALDYFEQALALGYPQVDELYQHIGDLHTINGNYPAAIHSYEAGIAHAHNGYLASLEHALGNVFHRMGEWELAESYFAAALKHLEPTETSERARLLIDWSLSRHIRGLTTEAQHLAGEALALAEKTGSAVSQAQAHNMLGILARKNGDLQLAGFHLQQSYQIAVTLNDFNIHIASLNNLALMFSDLERPQEAQQLLEQALEKCARVGDRHREAALHNNIADLLHKKGFPEQAMEHLKHAVALFAQVGVNGQEMKPEIWRLTEW